MRRLFHRIRTLHPRIDDVYEWARKRKDPIFLEFPVHPKARWGYSTGLYEPLVAFLGRYDDRFRAAYSEMNTFQTEFAAISRHQGADPALPFWENTTFPTLDAMALYQFLVKLNPKTYVEIGSGNSTKFARHAINQHKLRTKVVSIDPNPRAEVDAICDVSIRASLEDQSLDIFEKLEPGDIVFFDGSHYSFQNSDTVDFFLDILPRIPAGVWVQIHDINWPKDYGPDTVLRYFSEQYMLAAYIIGGAARMEMQLANAYGFEQLKIGETMDSLFSAPSLQGLRRVGASFWFSLS